MMTNTMHGCPNSKPATREAAILRSALLCVPAARFRNRAHACGYSVEPRRLYTVHSTARRRASGAVARLIGTSTAVQIRRLRGGQERHEAAQCARSRNLCARGVPTRAQGAGFSSGAPRFFFVACVTIR